MFSVVPNADAMGGRDSAASTTRCRPASRRSLAELHARGAVQRPRRARALLDERGDEIACLILEPVMMNIGIVRARSPATSQGSRELLHRHGVVLIFDEVKSGATIAAGGAIERYGVQPDLACFAKAIGGGTPGGRVRRRRRRDGRDRPRAPPSRARSTATRWSRRPGSPRSPRSSRPTPTSTSPRSGTRLADGLRRRRIAEHGIPAHTVDLGAKGCVSYRPEPLHELPRLPRDQHRALRRRRTRGWSTAACS